MYLEIKHFTVVTDHASLKYIKTQSNLSRRQARWLETLQSHDFEVRYRPGKTNIAADALSRKLYLNAMVTLITTLTDDQVFEQGYQQDKYFVQILDTLQHPEQASEKAKAHVKNFEWKNNRIYLKQGNRLAIPDDKRLRTHILQEHHDIDTAGHLGIDKTTEAVMRNFYWPKMGKDIKRYIQTCDTCQ